MTTRSLILAALGTAAIGVLLVFFVLTLAKRRRKPSHRAEVRVQTGVEVETGRLAIPSGPFDRKMNVYQDEGAARKAPQGPMWQVALTDQATGRCYQGRFCGTLYLGREQAEPKEHVLFVGTDTSISRLQCLLMDKGDSVSIENSGQANPTRLNGTVLSGAQALNAGDVIAFAGTQLKVTGLRRVDR